MNSFGFLAKAAFASVEELKAVEPKSFEYSISVSISVLLKFVHLKGIVLVFELTLFEFISSSVSNAFFSQMHTERSATKNFKYFVGKFEK